jgi:hypothetical protein
MGRPKKTTELSLRDREDLEWYAAELASLALHGQSLEPPSTGGDEPTTPRWLRSFARTSDSALARAIWTRLVAATDLFAPAAIVLLALHDPAAVMLDGATSMTDEEADRARRDPTFRVRERLDVGRRLAVYPCTWSADEARRWAETRRDRADLDHLVGALQRLTGERRKPGPKRVDPLEHIAPHVVLRGKRARDALAQMVDAKRHARGEAAAAWSAMDAEAVALVGAASAAWNAQVDHRARRPRMETDVIRGAA